MMQPLLALCDCNEFYVSCECVFRPDLWGKPVGVLSNNDGCFIARNKALKSLGVKMGVPLFQVADLVKKHDVHLFSSNFALYADMSSRVMSLLETFSPKTEIYSIDEAFLDLTGVYPCTLDPIAYGQRIKKTVYRATGIPICVGMGPTKTLAKLANFAAKKWKKTGGVLDLSDPQRRDRLMKIVPVCEVWGIGSRTSAKLNQLGIHTVWDLAIQPTQRIREEFNVVVARTVMELNGIPCLALEEIAPDKQQIVCSRSFSRRLTEFLELSAALAEFGSRAAEKLRKQCSVTGCITVFIRTKPFNPNEPQYQRSASIKRDTGTQDTRIIVSMANRLLETIYKPGYGYQKAGVQLSHIQSEALPGQFDLFDYADNNLPTENRALMKTIDKINRRFPKAVSIASTGLDKTWKSKTERISQRYTTDWKELVTVKC